MLKLSKSTEYALFALKYLANNSNGNSISTKEISDSMNIPYNLLAKIMQKLVRHKIIKSQYGKTGGYSINVPPKNLSLKDIINAVDQKLQITDCMYEGATENDCMRLNKCEIRNPLHKIQNKLINVLHSTNLEELI